MTGRAVSLPVGMSPVATEDHSAIEVELGTAGRGVFVTFVSIRGKRFITVGLTSAKARALAKTLTQAADASDHNAEPTK